jgi:hypothetical protein
VDDDDNQDQGKQLINELCRNRKFFFHVMIPGNGLITDSHKYFLGVSPLTR